MVTKEIKKTNKLGEFLNPIFRIQRLGVEIQMEEVEIIEEELQE